VPYKEGVITELSLPKDQWALWKIDMHYSHRDKEFIDLATEHHIALLCVLPGCTDLRQVSMH
jgi:hypothetical protein